MGHGPSATRSRVRHQMPIYRSRFSHIKSTDRTTGANTMLLRSFSVTITSAASANTPHPNGASKRPGVLVICSDDDSLAEDRVSKQCFDASETSLIIEYSRQLFVSSARSIDNSLNFSLFSHHQYSAIWSRTIAAKRPRRIFFKSLRNSSAVGLTVEIKKFVALVMVRIPLRTFMKSGG